MALEKEVVGGSAFRVRDTGETKREGEEAQKRVRRGKSVIS
jgi:hypothetical protein